MAKIIGNLGLLNICQETMIYKLEHEESLNLKDMNSVTGHLELLFHCSNLSSKKHSMEGILENLKMHWQKYRYTQRNQRQDFM